MEGKIVNWIRPIICGLIVAFIIWVLGKLWESEKMKTYLIDFLITFSPVIIGFLAFLIYWFIRDYRKLRKFCYQHNHGIKSEELSIWEPKGLQEIINEVAKKT